MRHSAFFLALIAALLGGVAAVATAQPAATPAPEAKPQCFMARDINSFSAPDDHTLYLKVGVSRVYRLDLMGDCRDLHFRQSVGVEAKPVGAWICSPLDAEVVYRDTGVPEHCPITTLHQLSNDELAKLPKKDQP